MTSLIFKGNTYHINFERKISRNSVVKYLFNELRLNSLLNKILYLKKLLFVVNLNNYYS
jgi:hypothetical protein